MARREERLKGLAAELEGEGVRAEVIGCDLGDPAERDRLQSEIESLGLAVDVLVNNAGFGGGEDFVQSERQYLLDMIRLNIEAVTDLMSRYVPGMVDRGHGAVLNVASVAAFQPLPGTANYAATKSFVLSLSEALSEEVKGSGVTVSALCPGPVKTEFVEAPGLESSTDTPDMIWMSAEDVAADAVKGLERGKRVIVPGLLNRAQSIAGQHSPRAVLLPLAKKVWSSATRD